MGGAPTQREETDAVFTEVHLRADETMRPLRGNREGSAEEAHVALIVRSAQEDHGSLGRQLEVELPGFREGASEGRGLAALSGDLADGSDEEIGLEDEVAKRRKMESTPDLGLPAPVEAFDAVLKTRFSGRGEDGNHAEAETHAGDASDDIGVILRAEEPRVVVELRVVREATLSPMLEDVIHDGTGGYAVLGPGGRESSEKGNAVEDVNEGAVLDGQILDHIKAVEFGSLGCEGRQVPAGGRGMKADALPAVQDAPALQDSTDGAKGGDRGNVHGSEFAQDGRGPELAEGGLHAQMRTDLQDSVLQGSVASVGRMGGARWAVGEVDAVQAPIARASAPELDCTQRDGVTPRYFAHGGAVTDQGDHGSASMLNGVLCFMSASLIDQIASHGDGESLTLK